MKKQLISFHIYGSIHTMYERKYKIRPLDIVFRS